MLNSIGGSLFSPAQISERYGGLQRQQGESAGRPGASPAERAGTAVEDSVEIRGEDRGNQRISFGYRELNEQQQREIEELERREQEVRRHEQAHRSRGGQYVRGGIQYEYDIGPDGRRYVTGGEVSIDVSEVDGDPQATIRKMQQIRSAALAPAEPSPQDRRVAAEASRLEAQARAELRQQAADIQAQGVQGSNQDSQTGDAGLSQQRFNPFQSYVDNQRNTTAQPPGTFLEQVA